MKSNETQQSRGYITPQGYRRIRVRGTRQFRMEHDLVWEEHHGPIPTGKEIHHRNGIKLDNRIENLQLVTRLEHKRIHSGCELRNDVWWKPCRGCGVFKPVDCYYAKPVGIMQICKTCAIARAIRAKQKRRLLSKSIHHHPVDNGVCGANSSPTLAPVASEVGA